MERTTSPPTEDPDALVEFILVGMPTWTSPERDADVSVGADEDMSELEAFKL